MNTKSYHNRGVVFRVFFSIRHLTVVQNDEQTELNIPHLETLELMNATKTWGLMNAKAYSIVLEPLHSQ